MLRAAGGYRAKYPSEDGYFGEFGGNHYPPELSAALCSPTSWRETVPSSSTS